MLAKRCCSRPWAALPGGGGGRRERSACQQAAASLAEQPPLAEQCPRFSWHTLTLRYTRQGKGTKRMSREPEQVGYWGRQSGAREPGGKAGGQGLYGRGRQKGWRTKCT